MAKSLLSLLLVALVMTAVSAFGGYSPVLKTASPSQRTTPSSNLVMRARVCDLLGKKPNRQARVVTFSHKRIKKVQHVNLQWKRFFSEELNRNVRLRLSTKGIKTVNKVGSIDAAAKKFDVDLTKF
ncbi:protein L28, chloroplastic [Seminavis robusta]|uniref:Large ribosomal subunit protein bL28c n=1 Tax=Seminavis robusta TaxID=568900 RepID=A0A9N8DX55_9STRA|nr:protein L28, chloroplastic [Seminavis robusta]|eukprot:Sro339_g121110.1 protein L28, chloroplastic (126) ;mRNA; r:64041-64661